jgi:hypothetical protein
MVDRKAPRLVMAGLDPAIHAMGLDRSAIEAAESE